MKATVYTKVGNRGWYPAYFEIETDQVEVNPADLTLTVTETHAKTQKNLSITAVSYADGKLRLVPESFSYDHDFELTGTASAEGISFSKADMAEVAVEGLNQFRAINENGVVYRLYSPKADGPRPLLLYLHGGGEGGTDNRKQMTGTLGAIKLAERYPDLFVLAPQAPAPDNGSPFPFANPGMQTFTGLVDRKGHGWHREYLAAVCDVIRKMIAEQKVDPKRIYVTGLSMGGGGTLRMLSVGKGLFAAAAPICPTMTPETYNILRSVTDLKVWVSTAYVDHTIYRHKYIVDAIMEMKDAGNKNAHLTLFSPEDLAKYGLSIDPELPLDRKFAENHASWILVYNGEYGIMDWLVSQHKE